jgi:hypothetical protein
MHERFLLPVMSLRYLDQAAEFACIRHPFRTPTRGTHTEAFHLLQPSPQIAAPDGEGRGLQRHATDLTACAATLPSQCPKGPACLARRASGPSLVQ